MDKTEQYLKLHTEIAKKHNTTESVIRFIRVSIISLKKTQQEMIAHCLHRKMRTPKYKEKWDARLKFLLNTDLQTLNKIVSYPTAPKDTLVGGQKREYI